MAPRLDLISLAGYGMLVCSSLVSWTGEIGCVRGLD